MVRLPMNAQTAYSDLLARLQDDAILETGGSPILKTVRGRQYWYSRIYIGNQAKDKYLGPDTVEMRRRIDRLNDIKADRKARQRQRRQLVQALRVSGVPPTDAATGKVLSALARVGVFRLRGVLIGTHAFRLYPFVLGVQLDEALHTTEDIDVAQFHEISLGLDDKVDPLIQDALATVGKLTPAASLYPQQPTGYRVGDDALVEILAPNTGPERDEPLELPALGVYARALRFLDFLLAYPIPAAVPYRYGILVNLPQPARYAVHKLIVATRRDPSVAVKRHKDLEQSAALIRVLASDQPEELAEAWFEAGGRGPGWKGAIEKGARRLPEDAREALNQTVMAFDNED